ncbi:MAG: 4-hydroxy-tetrahydrodipicolinate synthase [Pseudomonadota bacterium]
MQPSRTVRGIVPVVHTPLNADESLDVAALQRLIDFLAAQRVGGLWVLGTGSEDMNLSFRKRLQVAEVTTAANRGRLPLILGAGFFAMEDILEFMQATKHLQFDAYHVMPYHPLLGLDRMEWFYRHIADRAPKPLWMYTSGNWCRAFPPEFIATMKNHSNIAGIKYSTNKAPEVMRATAMAEPDFQVITAVAGQLLACLAMGAKGSTTSVASALPEPLIEIYEHFQAGRHDEALAGQRRLNGFLDAMPKGAKRSNFLTGAEEKYILSLRGICRPTMTSYYAPLTDAEQAEVRAALKKFAYDQWVAQAA